MPHEGVRSELTLKLVSLMILQRNVKEESCGGLPTSVESNMASQRRVLPAESTSGLQPHDLLNYASDKRRLASNTRSFAFPKAIQFHTYILLFQFNRNLSYIQQCTFFFMRIRSVTMF